MYKRERRQVIHLKSFDKRRADSTGLSKRIPIAQSVRLNDVRPAFCYQPKDDRVHAIHTSEKNIDD